MQQTCNLINDKFGKRGNGMHLEDYFDFLAPDDIRLKGTRIGIETILYDLALNGLQGGRKVAGVERQK